MKMKIGVDNEYIVVIFLAVHLLYSGWTCMGSVFPFCFKRQKRQENDRESHNCVKKKKKEI
jgi:hypothetical protein